MEAILGDKIGGKIGDKIGGNTWRQKLETKTGDKNRRKKLETKDWATKIPIQKCESSCLRSICATTSQNG